MLEILIAHWTLFSYSSQIHVLIRWKKSWDLTFKVFRDVFIVLLLYFLLNFLDYPLQSCSRKEDFTLIKERQVPEHQSPKLDVWKHPNPYVKWTWTQSFAVCQSLWEGRKSAETQKNRGDKKAKFDPRCKMLRGKKQSLWEEFLSRKTWTSLPYKHLGIRNSSPCTVCCHEGWVTFAHLQ